MQKRSRSWRKKGVRGWRKKGAGAKRGQRLEGKNLIRRICRKRSKSIQIRGATVQLS